MDSFSDPAVGIVGPKLIFKRPLPDGKTEDLIQSCGGLFDATRGPFHRYIGFNADYWLVNQPEEVSWTTGAALAVRRELFYKVGGLSLDYQPAYFEDTDLCMRVRELGSKVFYQPGCVFEHEAGTSGGIPAHLFKANSLKFHKRWDEKIKPDVNVQHVNY